MYIYIEKYEHTLNRQCKLQITVYNMVQFGKIKKLLLLHMFNNHSGTFCVLATIIKVSDSSVKTEIKSLFL